MCTAPWLAPRGTHFVILGRSIGNALRSIKTLRTSAVRCRKAVGPGAKPSGYRRFTQRFHLFRSIDDAVKPGA